MAGIIYMKSPKFYNRVYAFCNRLSSRLTHFGPLVAIVVGLIFRSALVGVIMYATLETSRQIHWFIARTFETQKGQKEYVDSILKLQKKIVSKFDEDDTKRKA